KAETTRRGPCALELRIAWPARQLAPAISGKNVARPLRIFFLNRFVTGRREPFNNDIRGPILLLRERPAGKGRRANARNDNGYNRGESNEARALAHGSPREGPKTSAPVERQRLAPAVAKCYSARLRAPLKFRTDRVLAIG